jgi:peptidoglycan/LPS O-acetylase OafA/YrhL
MCPSDVTVPRDAAASSPRYSESAESTAKPRTTQHRFAFVNALRGVGALGVVLYHGSEGGHIPGIMSVMPAWMIATMQHSGLSIATFFTLSGFVIAHSVYADRVTLLYAARFMLRRSVRLDPPYLVAIALVLVFAGLSAIVVPGKNLPDLSAAQLFAHLFYVQEMLSYAHVNPVFWTLCLEIQFYLAYVILLYISRNDPSQPLHGTRTAIVLVSATLVSLLWPMGVFSYGPWPGSFLPHWHGFLVGVGAYWAWRNPRIVPFYLALILTVATVALLRGDAFSFICAASAGVLWFVFASGRNHVLSGWPVLQFLGAISYSLYLTHNPITGATFRAGYMITGHTPFWEAFWWLGSMVSSLLFATAVWWLVEMPSIRWAKKLAKRQDG